MAYVFVLLVTLGVFLWATPAHTVLAERARSAVSAITDITASGSEPFRAQLDRATAAVRTKSMELLREQLHAVIDDMVR